MLIDKVETKISNSNSIISFETTGGGNWDVWDRFLAIDGKKAFHLGNICGTCAFFFERLEGANKSINAVDVVTALNGGLTKIDSPTLTGLKEIIPDGDYIVVLSKVSSSLTVPKEENDYFSNEQIDLWGIDDFWGMPHHPKTEYYRLSTSVLGKKIGFYEFIIPTFPHNWLEDERIEEYRSLLRNDKKPTAVSISVLDIKEPADWGDDKTITSHWCLAHYVIDGHHKVYAAALEGKPLTMISFLATEQGISSADDINQLITQMQRT